ncbi:MAG: M48 family metallopeptidase [Planctomycetota bacterium]
MDFAEQQYRARRRTTLLLWIYFLATLLVSLLVMLLIWATIAMSARIAVLRSSTLEKQRDAEAFSRTVNEWLRLDTRGLLVMGACVAITMILIFGSSWWKYLQLMAGGRVVAESMRGRLIPTSSRDPDERRALNVVEEMALAAGMPIPPVYVMDRQPGINAFAAGRSPHDAVVGITEGAMRRLSRDQLQGVIAHEFSHILNGDMRLNLRLIALLHGLLAIYVVGRVILEIAFHSGRGDSKRGGLALIPPALGLMLVGLAGWVIGRLLQASVSRQREFLADASAVQFTRNPQGITDALRSIGGASRIGTGASIKGADLDEYRHMFFASSLSLSAAGLMATHPPLPDRIKRLDPRWDGSYITPPPLATLPSPGAAYAPGGASHERGRTFIRDVVGGIAAASTLSDADSSYALSLPPSMSIEDVTGKVERSRGLLTRLPHAVAAALHEPYEARLVIFAILLSGNKSVRDIEVAALRPRLSDHEMAKTLELSVLLDADPALATATRLPMVQIALSGLSALSVEQFTTFRDDARSIINADGRVELDEWLLERLVEQQLAVRIGAARTPRELRPLKALSRQCAVVLWTLAYAGNKDQAQAMAAARHGVDQLTLGALTPPAPADLTRDELDAALKTLSATPSPIRARIMRACAAVVGTDAQVTDRESDLLLFLAQMLRTPLP